MFPPFDWHASPGDLLAAAAPALPRMHALEDALGQRATWPGWCTACEALREFTVSGHAMLGTHLNLREGFVCPHCGINARGRLLLQAAAEAFAPGAELALFEAFSPLAARMRAQWPALRCSEYFGPGAAPGEEQALVLPDGREMRASHQDLLRLGYPDASLDGVLHNDVLEHVPDVARALAEMFRVLKPGGLAVFTMPWFPWRERTLVRGRLSDDGTLEEFEPTERHGDGLRAEGVYTFYNFGADLGEAIAAAGFDEVAYGVCYEPACGFVGNNFRYGTDGLMLPTVLRARRPARPHAA